MLTCTVRVGGRNHARLNYNLGTTAVVNSSDSNLRRRDISIASLEEGVIEASNLTATEDIRSLGESDLSSAEMLEFIYRKRIYKLIDSAVVIYRHAVPINIWILFFRGGPSSTFFITLYLAVKFWSLSWRIRSFSVSVLNTLFGRCVST